MQFYWHRNQQPINEQGYSTDLIANEVVRSLATHKAQNAKQPFFYYVPFNAIHGPLETTPRHSELGKRYAALKCLDDAVGRIMGAVEQHGFKKNTLVVFANDNGAIRDSMNAPYRGTKNTNYEGGVRAPCVLSWPNKIQANTTSDELAHITDFFPTFIKLGGGSLDQKQPIDGFDLNEVIFNQQKTERTEIVFEVAGSVRPPAIRQGAFKLIGEELFNVVEDPYETKNLANANPEMVAKLKNRVVTVGNERPPLPDMSLLMTPALPWVYGALENANAPNWVKEKMRQIRAKQPQEWTAGTTPWPQAPKDGKIIYTGDGR